MRKALKKPANSAAWTTNQFEKKVKAGMAYEDEDCVHLFEPFFLAFAVNDLCKDLLTVIPIWRYVTLLILYNPVVCLSCTESDLTPLPP